MRFRVLLGFLALTFSSISSAQAVRVCTLDTAHPEFCARMKHLRATVNVVDAQRELMLVDYPFLSALAASIENNAKALQTVLPSSLNSHMEALSNIESLATDLSKQAGAQDPNSLVSANTIRTNCLSCHGTTNPPSGSWNDVFGFDWDRISSDCNKEGRNPYLCKSMNALFTNYNQILTASYAKIRSFPTTAALAKDIVRILVDLKEKNFGHHLGEIDRQLTENTAREVVELANAKDPSAFERALRIDDACVKCHTTQAARDMPRALTKLNAFHN